MMFHSRKLLFGLVALWFLIQAPGVLAQSSACQPILRQGLARYLMSKANLPGPLIVQRQFCSRTAKVRKKGDRVILFKGRLRISRQRFRQLKKIFCKSISAARLRRVVREVGRVISRRSRVMFRRCNTYEKGGGAVVSVATQVGTRPFVNFNLTPGDQQSLSGILSQPANVFSCNSSLQGLQNNSPFTNSPIIGQCSLNEDSVELDSVLQFNFNSGSFGFEFDGVQADANPLDPGLLAPNRGLQTQITIDDCEQYQANPEILECSTISSYQNCLTELYASNLEDCRANIPANINPTFPYSESEVNGTLLINGNASITVTEGNPGGGSSSGTANYSLSIPTPTLSTATNCDPNCPVNVCGNNPCNRNCIKADRYTEQITGSAGGLFAISALSAPTCTRSISGELSPDSTDLYRAYEACERSNSWGGNTQINMVLNAGKLYQFNNPTAEHIGNAWIYTNIAELVYHYRELELPVGVNCNQ